MIDEERLYRSLGDRLRKLREVTNGRSGRLTQAELADRVGLERTSITNIERGNQKVPLHVLYRMCEVFGVSVENVIPALAEVQPAELASLEISGGQQLPPKAASVVTRLVGEDSI